MNSGSLLCFITEEVCGKVSAFGSQNFPPGRWSTTILDRTSCIVWKELCTSGIIISSVFLSSEAKVSNILSSTEVSNGVSSPLKTFQPQLNQQLLSPDTQLKYNSAYHIQYTVELQWPEHLRDHENQFEAGVVRANEGRL